MTLFILFVAAASAVPFQHGASIATTWSVGAHHQQLTVGPELPLVTSPHQQGRIPGPPAWQLFVLPAVTGGYHPGERVEGGVSVGPGVRYVAPFGWKGELVGSAGLAWDRRIDGVEPKSSSWFVPRASMRIGRDDWLPYHSRISWHFGPALEARVAQGKATELIASVDLGFSWRLRRP